jgi:hypothetical protein
MNMKTYIGVQMVSAMEMTRGEYNTFRGLEIPENENPNDPGYMVKYQDGYVTWAQKYQFEKFCLEIQDETKITISEVVKMVDGVSTTKLDEKTTLVSSKGLTGFVTHSVSSCVDPKNYDEKIGKEIGEKRIQDKIWGHLGFVLQWAKNGLGA